MHMVDLWLYYSISIRSGVTRCTLIMVQYLIRMSQCGTLGALVAHWYAYPPRRCRTTLNHRTFSPANTLSVSLWNDRDDPVFDGVGLAGFKSRANSFLLL